MYVIEAAIKMFYKLQYNYEFPLQLDEQSVDRPPRQIICTRSTGEQRETRDPPFQFGIIKSARNSSPY